MLNVKKERESRVLLPDGNLNIARKAQRRLPFSDIYHFALNLSWPKFLIRLLIIHLGINLLFATAYYFCGPESIQANNPDPSISPFLRCFFFSVQTFSTIGYGHLHPHGLAANIIVTIEALIGVLSIALITGLFFARLSKPTAKIVFSKYALITTLDHQRCLIFRAANTRLNQIAEARANAVMIKTELTPEGKNFRKIEDLQLLRHVSPLFALSWTIIHPIDDSSPLKNLDDHALKEKSVEILISLVGFDETFSQSIRARRSYTAEEIIWNAHFVDIVRRDEAGQLCIDFEKIDEYQWDGPV